jgi:CubicO group peptidase (beta-lactamase class C family)
MLLNGNARKMVWSLIRKSGRDLMNVLGRIAVTSCIVPAILFALLVFPALSWAQALDYARKPEDVGFSHERLDRIAETINADIAKGIIPGATLLIARNGKVAYFEAFGSLDAASRTPMPKEAIFRIYSMSKPITSLAAMILVEQGRLFLDDPVQKYIPAFGNMKVAAQEAGSAALDLVPATRPITVQDLLRHTSGLTYGFLPGTPVAKMYQEANLFGVDLTNAEFADKIARLPLITQPGSSWNYSHSTDVLGRVVEVASGKPLYQFEKENILDPLGMTDTAFSVADAAKQNLIAEPLPADSKIVGTEPFSNPRRPAKWEAGGQGMVSTAPDYAKFLQMMQNGGVLNGHRILAPATIAFMTADHLGPAGVGPTPYLPGPGYGFGLGFAVRRQQGVAPAQGSPGDYTWAGAAGTSFWNDPAQHLTVIFMVQAPSLGNHYRVLLRNMVYGALTEPER